MRTQQLLILWIHVLLPIISIFLTPGTLMVLAKVQSNRAKLISDALTTRTKLAAATAKFKKPYSYSLRSRRDVDNHNIPGPTPDYNGHLYKAELGITDKPQNGHYPDLAFHKAILELSKANPQSNNAFFEPVSRGMVLDAQSNQNQTDRDEQLENHPAILQYDGRWTQDEISRESADPEASLHKKHGKKHGGHHGHHYLQSAQHDNDDPAFYAAINKLIKPDIQEPPKKFPEHINNDELSTDTVVADIQEFRPITDEFQTPRFAFHESIQDLSKANPQSNTAFLESVPQGRILDSRPNQNHSDSASFRDETPENHPAILQYDGRWIQDEVSRESADPEAPLHKKYGKKHGGHHGHHYLQSAHHDNDDPAFYAAINKLLKPDIQEPPKKFPEHINNDELSTDTVVADVQEFRPSTDEFRGFQTPRFASGEMDSVVGASPDELNQFDMQLENMWNMNNFDARASQMLRQAENEWHQLGTSPDFITEQIVSSPFPDLRLENEGFRQRSPEPHKHKHKHHHDEYPRPYPSNYYSYYRNNDINVPAGENEQINRHEGHPHGRDADERCEEMDKKSKKDKKGHDEHFEPLYYGHPTAYPYPSEPLPYSYRTNAETDDQTMQPKSAHHAQHGFTHVHSHTHYAKKDFGGPYPAPLVAPGVNVHVIQNQNTGVLPATYPQQQSYANSQAGAHSYNGGSSQLNYGQADAFAHSGQSYAKSQASAIAQAGVSSHGFLNQHGFVGDSNPNPDVQGLEDSNRGRFSRALNEDDKESSYSTERFGPARHIRVPRELEPAPPEGTILFENADQMNFGGLEEQQGNGPSQDFSPPEQENQARKADSPKASLDHTKDFSDFEPKNIDILNRPSENITLVVDNGKAFNIREAQDAREENDGRLQAVLNNQLPQLSTESSFAHNNEPLTDPTLHSALMTSIPNTTNFTESTEKEQINLQSIFNADMDGENLGAELDPEKVFNATDAFASLEEEMKNMTKEQKEDFFQKEMDLIFDVVRDAMINHPAFRGMEEINDSKSERSSLEHLKSPNLFRAHARSDWFMHRFDDRREYKRSVKTTEEHFDDLLGRHEDILSSIKENAKNDEDLLMISYIGDGLVRDFRDRRNRPVAKRRKREMAVLKPTNIPWTRLVSDSGTKIDVPKTLDHIGAVTRQALENSRAPLFHVRSLIGNAKNSVMSAMKVPPNNLIIPSKYEIAKMGTNDAQLGAINTKLVDEESKTNLKPTEERPEAPSDPLGVMDTFQKLGNIIKESVDTGKNTVVHINDAAADARNVLYTARNSAPRLIVPSELPLPVSDINTYQRLGKKAVLIAPKVLDFSEDRLGSAQEQPPNGFLGLGHLMDAVGLSNPQRSEVKLQKIVLEPEALRVMQKWEKPKELTSGAAFSKWIKDRTAEQRVGETVLSLNQAKKSLGASSFKEFVELVKEYATQKQRELEKQLDEVKRPIYGIDNDKKDKQGGQEKSTGPQVGLYLPPNLMRPFMGQASDAQLSELMRENGNEDNGNKQQDLGHVLGAINPRMFERYFNESLDGTKERYPSNPGTAKHI
ncbi:uncharacterized protein LOC132699470 isoform X2 [Cylas formicarius]|uniref:uncharacterized protein LOC132699470 isoform X2 n=1 Tax=Cylas formicarius TaxID=197179 RepID=UPI002958A597|nr:uncharacterized protein LOC132699470 isoform X2 [Cylas formicarius]